MHHGQAIPEIVDAEQPPKHLERFKAALRLPRSTILPAQDRVSRGEIGFADAQSAPRMMDKSLDKGV